MKYYTEIRMYNFNNKLTLSTHILSMLYKLLI